MAETSFWQARLALVKQWLRQDLGCMRSTMVIALILGILPQVSTEKELLSCIKQAKGSAESLFDYRIINDSKRLGVEVSLKSEIIDVDGFPFKAFVGDNVNILIDERIQSHLSEESQ